MESKSERKRKNIQKRRPLMEGVGPAPSHEDWIDEKIRRIKKEYDDPVGEISWMQMEQLVGQLEQAKALARLTQAIEDLLDIVDEGKLEVTVKQG